MELEHIIEAGKIAGFVIGGSAVCLTAYLGLAIGITKIWERKYALRVTNEKGNTDIKPTTWNAMRYVRNSKDNYK